jgi:hypothetical protein
VTKPSRYLSPDPGLLAARPLDLSKKKKTLRYARRRDPQTGQVYYTGLEEGDSQEDEEEETASDSEQESYTEDDPRSAGYQSGPRYKPFLPKAGSVYDPPPSGFERRIKKKKTPSGLPPLDPAMRTLNHYGISANDPVTGVTLATGSCIYESTRALAKGGKEAHTWVTEKAPSIHSNWKVDSFNYDIEGKDQYEILGSKFLKTLFASESARLLAMRAIFQRVVDDPETPQRTLKIALEALGQFDLPKQHMKDANSSAIAAARLVSEGTLSGVSTQAGYAGTSLIPPPRLGDVDGFGPNILKLLSTSTGLGDKKYSVGDPDSQPLKVFLTPLVSLIESSRLNEQAAYALLMAVLKGETQDQVRNAYFEDGIPFEETWITLQKTAPRYSSSIELQKKLNSQFEKKPDRIESVLTTLQNIRAKMCEEYPDPTQRKVLAAQLTIKDYRNLCHTFYPSQASIIDTMFRTRKQAEALDRKQREMEGRPCPFRPTSEINMLKEIICSVLCGPDAISEGPSFLFGGSVAPDPAHKGRKNVDIHTMEVTNVESAPMAGAPVTAQPAQGAPQYPAHQPSSRGGGSKRGGSRGQGPRTTHGNFGQGRLAPYSADSYFVPGTGTAAQTVIAPGTVDQTTNQQVAMGQAQVTYTQPPQQAPRQLWNPPGQPRADGGQTQKRTTPQICFDKLRGRCFNCASDQHWATSCPLYPNQYPIERECPQCGGCHPKECKGVPGALSLAVTSVPVRPQATQPQQENGGPRQRNEANYELDYRPRPRFNNGSRGGGRGSFNRGGGGYGGNRYPPRQTFQPQQPYYSYPQQQPQYYPQQTYAPPQQTYAPQPAQMMVPQQPQMVAMPQQQMMQPQQMTQQPAVPQPGAVPVPRQGVLGNGGVQQIPENVFMSTMGAQQMAMPMTQAPGQMN